MFNTNMQTDFPTVRIPSYDVTGVLCGYEQTKGEKPEEHTVLPRLAAKDFEDIEKKRVFVSVSGDDEAGTGNENAPYRTLARALKRFEGGTGGEILLREGSYEGACLDARHSGTPESPLFITAYKDEKVTFSCGKTFDPSLLIPVREAPFVTKEELLRFDRFTKDNSKNIYAIDLTTLGFKKEDFEAYLSGETSAPLYVGEKSAIVARFPNMGENDPDRKIANGRVKTMNVEEGKLNVRKNGKVWWGASTLYDEHKDDVGSWEIYIDDTTYGERAAAYDNVYGDLYLYGAVYEEWDIQNSNVRITKEDGHTVMAHTGDVTKWGCKSNGHTSFYFHNMPEDLDCEGEYLIDSHRLICYVYGRPSEAITIVPSDTPIFDVQGTSNAVISDLSFRYTKGVAVTLKETDHVLVQSCSFRALGSVGLLLDNAYQSGATYNLFEGCQAIKTAHDKSKMKPSCNIIQNNVFDNTIGNQSASCMVMLYGGYGDVVSHNLMNQCSLTFNNEFDLVLEYNEARHGNRFVRDNGPFYGGVSNRGMHIRYNYLHDLDYSRYGIYLDDMASGNYVYDNLVHYKEGEGGRCVNLHNGAMTVVENNVCINGAYPVMNQTSYSAYTVNGVRTGAGGGRQSWFAIANSFLYKQYHEGNAEVFESRYPMYAWLSSINDRSVAKMNANPNWSLFDKISPDEDDEIFTRMPANNVYRNNIAYACANPFGIPEYAKETCLVGENPEYAQGEDVGFVCEEAGDFRLREDAPVLKKLPEFRQIPIAKAGLTYCD